MTIHILNQYLWPDCAPTAIYAEKLADCLLRRGYEVRVIGGAGLYRPGKRPKPSVELVTLSSRLGRRGRVFSSLLEYDSIYRSFEAYILSYVKESDLVIGTSAPPQALGLIELIRQKKAIGIYWLQDYYPELLRGYWNYPEVVRWGLSRYWQRHLSKWHGVVKIAANLDYHGNNAVVIRNGPTLELGDSQPYEPGTACYFGNLGYGHSLEAFVQVCFDLTQKGYRISILGDGPKVSKLPDWILRERVGDEGELIQRHWRAEAHLIAADPMITGAIFPSKYWNSRLSGRQLIPSGFAGPMLEEWNAVQTLKALPSIEEWIPVIRRFYDSQA